MTTHVSTRPALLPQQFLLIYKYLYAALRCAKWDDVRNATVLHPPAAEHFPNNVRRYTVGYINYVYSGWEWDLFCSFISAIVCFSAVSKIVPPHPKITDVPPSGNGWTTATGEIEEVGTANIGTCFLNDRSYSKFFDNILYHRSRITVDIRYFIYDIISYDIAEFCRDLYMSHAARL